MNWGVFVDENDTNATYMYGAKTLDLDVLTWVVMVPEAAIGLKLSIIALTSTLMTLYLF